LNDLALEFINISKSFPGVQALKEVSIQIKKADVHAIVGENGAGKSTLMKIAVGELLRDAGIIKVFGREAQIISPSDGYSCGISLIHQEFSLVSTLDIAQNIFLGRELTRGNSPFMDSNLMHKQTEEILDSLKMFRLDSHLKIGDLTVAQKQVVEIAKALSLNSKIIIMDEPTAALTLEETRRLFEVVRGLKAKGVTTLFISHRLEEIFEIADKVSILRDGELILTKQQTQLFPLIILINYGIHKIRSNLTIPGEKYPGILTNFGNKSVHHRSSVWFSIYGGKISSRNHITNSFSCFTGIY